MGAVNNWQQLAGVRFCLGVIEAGFAPGVAFYLSSWYKRHELAKRYSIYYTATAVSVSCASFAWVAWVADGIVGRVLWSPCRCHHRPLEDGARYRGLALAVHH